jgi:hypothetical protein
LARQAAVYQASHRIRLADAFAAEKKAELVTVDLESRLSS